MYKWGITPHQFSTEPRWSRATIIAYIREKTKIDYWLYEDNKPKGK